MIILNPFEQQQEPGEFEISTPQQAARELVIHAAETFARYIDEFDSVDQTHITEEEKDAIHCEAEKILSYLRKNL